MGKNNGSPQPQRSRYQQHKASQRQHARYFEGASDQTRASGCDGFSVRLDLNSEQAREIRVKLAKNLGHSGLAQLRGYGIDPFVGVSLFGLRESREIPNLNTLTCDEVKAQLLGRLSALRSGLENASVGSIGQFGGPKSKIISIAAAIEEETVPELLDARGEIQAYACELNDYMPFRLGPWRPHVTFVTTPKTAPRTAILDALDAAKQIVPQELTFDAISIHTV